jgi:hypothetical protein
MVAEHVSSVPSLFTTARLVVLAFELIGLPGPAIFVVVGVIELIKRMPALVTTKKAVDRSNILNEEVDYVFISVPGL